MTTQHIIGTLACCAGVFAIAPAASLAATARVDASGRLTIVASPGETNVVTIDGLLGEIRVRDTGAQLRAGAGCSRQPHGGTLCAAALGRPIILRLGDRDDVAWLPDSPVSAQVDGDAGDDVIRAGNQGDVLDGGTGDDQLEGGAGNDNLAGGDGVDRLAGGWGADVLGGDGGKDALQGDDGDDRLAGGADDDVLSGGAGHDMVGGGDGVDFINGGTGDDQLDGADGRDSIYGEGGADELLGGAGDDELDPGDGFDHVAAGEGNDAIYPGDGEADVIGCGPGGDDRVDIEAIDAVDADCELLLPPPLRLRAGLATSYIVPAVKAKLVTIGAERRLMVRIEAVRNRETIEVIYLDTHHQPLGAKQVIDSVPSGRWVMPGAARVPRGARSAKATGVGPS